MSIYDVIKDDHRKVDELFEDIRECKDPDDRFALFESLREELLVHTKAEEKVFYSRLKKQLDERIDDAVEEHNDIEAMLARLQDLEPDSKSFLNGLADLEALFKHHIREEENAIFPRARQVLGEDADNSLARQFQTEKGKVQKREFASV